MLFHPGTIDTRLASITKENKQVLKGAAAMNCMNRLGETEEVANLVLMLASDEVGFSTGSEYVIDGGLTCQ